MCVGTCQISIHVVDVHEEALHKQLHDLVGYGQRHDATDVLDPVDVRRHAYFMLQFRANNVWQ